MVASVPFEKYCEDVFLSESRLIIANADQVTCWSLPDGEQKAVGPLHQNVVQMEWVRENYSNLPGGGYFAVSDDFSRIAALKNRTTVIVLDTRTGELISEVMVEHLPSWPLRTCFKKGSDPLRRGQKPNEIDSPPKGQTPF